MLRETEEDLLYVFQRNCLRIALGTRLIYHLSNSKLYEKFVSILVFRTIMKEAIRWLGLVLPMKDDKLPKIVFVGQPSRVKR